MVDLSGGLSGYQSLGPLNNDRKKEEERSAEITLSREDNKTKEIELKSSLVLAEAFYQEVLRFVVSIMEKVQRNEEQTLNGKEIMEQTGRFCDVFTAKINSDDLMRLVAQHDEMHKNNYVFIQAVNVCFVAVHIALGLKLSFSDLVELVTACLFHDIGMMKIPMEVWGKNERLNRSEELEVRKHPNLGSGVLQKIGDINDTIIMAVEQHQERSDGTGYPKQLKGNAISPLARFIGIVDRYEAMTHSRPWRIRYAPDQALQHILDEEASSFDPYYMKAILRYVSIFPVGSWVKISSGEVGNVVRTNENSPMRPIIDIVFDRDMKRINEPRLMDLSRQLLVHVEHCVNPEKLNVL